MASGVVRCPGVNEEFGGKCSKCYDDEGCVMARSLSEVEWYPDFAGGYKIGVSAVPKDKEAYFKRNPDFNDFEEGKMKRTEWYYKTPNELSEVIEGSRDVCFAEEKRFRERASNAVDAARAEIEELFAEIPEND